MQPTHQHALLPEPIAQHLAAGKRVGRMQLVDATHDRQITVRYRPWQVADAAPADPELPRLGNQRQRITAVDHRLALGNRPPFQAHRPKHRSPAFPRLSRRPVPPSA